MVRERDREEKGQIGDEGEPTDVKRPVAATENDSQPVSSSNKIKKHRRAKREQLRSRATGTVSNIETHSKHQSNKKILFRDDDDDEAIDQTIEKRTDSMAEPGSVKDEQTGKQEQNYQKISSFEDDEKDDDASDVDVEQVVTSTVQQQREQEVQLETAAASFWHKKKRRKNIEVVDQKHLKVSEGGDDVVEEDMNYNYHDVVLNDPSFFERLKKDREATRLAREKYDEDQLRLQRLRSGHKIFLVEDNNEGTVDRFLNLDDPAGTSLRVTTLPDNTEVPSLSYSPSATALAYSKSTLIGNGSDIDPVMYQDNIDHDEDKLSKYSFAKQASETKKRQRNERAVPSGWKRSKQMNRLALVQVAKASSKRATRRNGMPAPFFAKSK